ncbi:MAG: hypothetical protein WC827_01140 [Candidatus Paceibacterota bacterium]|jgi:hypothetical protein
MINLKLKNNKGFAMLFAVLISSMLITVGVSIFNISIKELMISGSVRDSQAAYYAADSAAECFLYWNYVGPGSVFSYCTGASCLELVTINCNDNDISFDVTRGPINSFVIADDSQKFRYSTDPNSDIQPEANIEVTKEIDGTIRTVADFFGYNTGISGRRVERYYQRTI